MGADGWELRVRNWGWCPSRAPGPLCRELGLGVHLKPSKANRGRAKGRARPHRLHVAVAVLQMQGVRPLIPQNGEYSPSGFLQKRIADRPPPRSILRAPPSLAAGSPQPPDLRALPHFNVKSHVRLHGPRGLLPAPRGFMSSLLSWPGLAASLLFLEYARVAGPWNLLFPPPRTFFPPTSSARGLARSGGFLPGLPPRPSVLGLERTSLPLTSPLP